MTDENPMIDRAFALIDEVRAEYAADARLTVFEVQLGYDGSTLVVYGAASIPAAVEALHARIGALDPAASIRDEVIRLPDYMDGRPPHALVRVAIAPMLAEPVISSSHLSTALLGHRVMVLREYGRWQQCRSADGYLGWMHRGYLCRVSEADARGWELGAMAPLHLSLGAEVVDEAGEVMVRLPWGARVGSRDGVALLPDGRTGLLRGELVPVEQLADRFPLSGERIVSTALAWAGTPYIWGGTTSWGADCSGLVQAVFRTHGMELPRDSDQQSLVGAVVEPTDGFANLLPGDLLFFAESQDRVSHVAISMGGPMIVHSAVGNGGVGINDLTGDNGFEQSLRELLTIVRRVIPPES